jgi:NAD-dependent SIR2 family protein deacetylase
VTGMGFVNLTEVVGLHLSNGRMVCSKCMTDEQIQNVREDEFIMQNEIENDEVIYFCDECKNSLR